MISHNLWESRAYRQLRATGALPAPPSPVDPLASAPTGEAPGKGPSKADRYVPASGSGATARLPGATGR